MMKKKNKIKKIIILLFFLLIILISIIVYLLLKSDINRDNTNNESENILDLENENTNIDNNTITSDETETSNEAEEEYESLKKVNDNYTYFLVNYCLEMFYDDNDYEDFSLNLIDTEAKTKLNLNEENLINRENSGFCIDEIYRQNIKEKESIYILKYRLGENSGEITNKVAWVRINETNKVFSIYPYEYLSSSNYLDLTENDVIPLENISDIEKNENNTYENSDINTNTQACIKELFRRYKFDLLLDTNHLYNTLDEEYRNLKFPNIEDLEQYINDHKSELYLDSIAEYSSDDYDTYVQLTGKGKDDRYYIFDVTSLMEYTMFMDNYTVVTVEEKYKTVLPNARAKYCINRVIKAINDKNYQFVYDKLNPVQKSNYYQNIDDFITFIQNHFYDKNKYEIAEEYLIISSDVYQFNVTVTDETEREVSSRTLKMTVTLKEDTDFIISIVYQG